MLVNYVLFSLIWVRVCYYVVGLSFLSYSLIIVLFDSFIFLIGFYLFGFGLFFCCFFWLFTYWLLGCGYFGLIVCGCCMLLLCFVMFVCYILLANWLKICF